ncbi:MAG: hypothetical protein AAGE65_11070 [Planctomycetota bacterium]
MRIATTVITMTAALLTSTPTLAQDVSEAREGAAWVAYVVAAVLTLGVAAVSFMGAKRTHEDT